MLVLTTDPVVLRGLERVARESGLLVLTPATRDADEPDVIVIDLDQPGAADEVARWRARLPDAFVAGHVGTPDQARWLEAERVGCDLVANRGAFAARLRQRLPPPGARRRPRLPLLEAAEVPGRLGLVVRVPETPLGPVALYHVRGRLCAVEDRCPHAGATLSEGELEGSIVTCPRHGSQFDVCTGERTRGPADASLRTFGVVEEDGFVHLLLDAPEER
jgi:nitrite reductase/ring-hydroxylating ferredoxin subunit